MIKGDTLKRWKVLIVLFVISGLAVCVSAPAHAEITNAGLLDNVLERYSTAASEWASIISDAASWLFWTLVLISMVWTFGMMALRKADIGEFFAELVRFTIFTGFFWWLLINGPNFAISIYDSLRQLGGTATGLGPGLSPSGIVDVGFEIFDKVLDQSSVWSPVDSFAGIAMGAIILVILALVGINMLLLLCAGWVLAYAGVFFLGFGGSRWTSDMAINYYKTVLGVAAQLLSMVLLVGIGKTFLDDYYSRMSAGISLNEMGVLLVVGVILLMLVNKIPQLISGIITGASVGGAGIGGMGAGAALGAAGMAAAAAATGGAAMAAGAANISGGTQALMAAFNAASEAESGGGSDTGLGSVLGGGGDSDGAGDFSEAAGLDDGGESDSAGSSGGDSPGGWSGGDDSAGGESAGGESAGGESAGGESAGGESAGGESAGGESAGSGSAGSGSAGNGSADSGSAGSGSAGSGSASSGSAGSGSAGNGSADSGSAGSGSAGSGSAGSGSAGSGSVGSGSADSGSAGSGSAANAAVGAAAAGGFMASAAKAGRIAAGTGANLAKGTGSVAKGKAGQMKSRAMQRIADTPGGQIASAIKAQSQGGGDSSEGGGDSDEEGSGGVEGSGYESETSSGADDSSGASFNNNSLSGSASSDTSGSWVNQTGGYSALSSANKQKAREAHTAWQERNPQGNTFNVQDYVSYAQDKQQERNEEIQSFVNKGR